MKYKTEKSAGGIVFKILKSKIINRKSDVVWLMTQHSQHKGWGFPKGKIGDTNENEHAEEAALREVQEEGGITAKIIDKTPVEVGYKYRFKEYLVDKTVQYFLMEYISGDPADHDWEVSEAKFATEEEVRKTLTFKTDKEAFEKILSKLR